MPHSPAYTTSMALKQQISINEPLVQDWPELYRKKYIVALKGAIIN